MLDEPSAGLSPKLTFEVFAKLAEIRGRGVTILLVEQNARAALVDRRPRRISSPTAATGMTAPAARSPPIPTSPPTISGSAAPRERRPRPVSLQFLVDGVVRRRADRPRRGRPRRLTYVDPALRELHRMATSSPGAPISRSAGIGALAGWLGAGARLTPFSFGWPLLARRPRRDGARPACWRSGSTPPCSGCPRGTGHGIVMVIASFGASLALRSHARIPVHLGAGLFQPRHPDRPARSASACASRPTRLAMMGLAGAGRHRHASSSDAHPYRAARCGR